MTIRSEVRFFGAMLTVTTYLSPILHLADTVSNFGASVSSPKVWPRKPMRSHLRSLRGRLSVLLSLLIAAAIATGVLMIDLFRQSATAQVGQAVAEIGRACDAIAGAYRFYGTGWQRPGPAIDDQAFRNGLSAVVQTALNNRRRVEGGIWQSEAGSLAYAFPTYEGGGPKTDVPQAELPRIQVINRSAATEDRPVSGRYDTASQILLLTACPLPGPVPGLTGWTMTRVITFAGRSYQQLMAGLGILFFTVLGAAVLLTRLTMKWSRHVSQIESALQAHDIAELPVLPATGERELDRIVTALNEAGDRLVKAREQADQLASKIAVGERLTSIGRVAAGVAHEIRNPIAAMRLKAESAIAGDADRKDQSLATILEQIDRLDGMLRRLLNATEPDAPHQLSVALAPFLSSCLAAHAELARAKGLTLECRLDAEAACFDPDQMRQALDNLILNAIAAAPCDSVILISLRREAENLVVSVHDEGAGPPARIRDHLFEPFVTGRAEGTGLGLALVREVAMAHGGAARLVDLSVGTSFEIVIPWQPS
jgi:signal transduction histidine kinase